MKRLIKFGFMFSLAISNNVFSIEPVQGPYLGLQLQVSRAIPNPKLTFIIDELSYSGSAPITLSPVGGGAGFSLGYRIQKVRLEGEFLFNINNYGELKVGSCTLVSPNVIGPQGICPSSISNDTGVGLAFNGNTMGFYGLFNVFYDFLSSNTEVKAFPYVGVGLGGAIIKNTANFLSNQYNTNGIIVSYRTSTSTAGFAAQGILGIGTYLDDFATIGLDLRYLSAFQANNSKNNNSNSQFGIATINFTATFALDKGDK